MNDHWMISRDTLGNHLPHKTIAHTHTHTHTHVLSLSVCVKGNLAYKSSSWTISRWQTETEDRSAAMNLQLISSVLLCVGEFLLHPQTSHHHTKHAEITNLYLIRPGSDREKWFFFLCSALFCFYWAFSLFDASVIMLMNRKNNAEVVEIHSSEHARNLFHVFMNIWIIWHENWSADVFDVKCVYHQTDRQGCGRLRRLVLTRL